MDNKSIFNLYCNISEGIETIIKLNKIADIKNPLFKHILNI
jgi:hypothetical protein